MNSRDFEKDMLVEYLQECQEMFERISKNLNSFEKNGIQTEKIHEIYRDVHSIKGASQLFGFQNLCAMSHGLETFLDAARHHGNFPFVENMDAVYRVFDLMQKVVKDVQEHGSEQDYGCEPEMVLIGILDEVWRYKSRWSWSSKVCHVDINDFARQKNLIEQKNMKEDHDVNPILRDDSEFSVTENSSVQNDIEHKKINVSYERSDKDKDVSRNHSGNMDRSKKTRVKKVESKMNQKSQESNEHATIRVQVNLLDNLMNLIGELVLIRNQVLQYTKNVEDSEFLKLSQRLNIVTSELQNDVMKTRMQPIGSVLSKFHRVVRDLSKELGKNIDLVLTGAETELDRTLIEAVKDPLMHIVRNSIDHGMETPEERKKNGKKEVGTLKICSSHEGGQVAIEIIDDGKGLSREKIVEKAIEKNLVSRESAEVMNDRDIHNLIFLPGFSTAQQVTNISGRGVGMDVVKTNIEKIGGALDLHSTEGQGTSLKLKIPLTLAIVPALIVRIEEERFAIPQVKVMELVRLDIENENQGSIEFLQGRPMMRLRGDLLPLIDLKQKMKFSHYGSDNENQEYNVAVLNAEGNIFGVIVDSIENSADIVVKPLNPFLKNLDIYSGATIMGDGQAILIFDVMGLVKFWLHGSLEDENIKNYHQTESKQKKNLTQETLDYLIIQLGVESDFAIPLCMINRLEEIPVSSVEWSGEQPMIRYRKSVLPLIDVGNYLGLSETNRCQQHKDEKMSVVVVTKNENYYGLVVENIRDVISHEGVIDSSFKEREGTLGNMVCDDKIYVVIDSLGLVDQFKKNLEQFHPEYKESSDDQTTTKDLRILVVDDMKFFRKHVASVVKKRGYAVDVAENGAAAWKMICDHPGEYAGLVSDIEMPQMTGLELIEKIRSSEDKRIADLPAIAMTTRFKDDDIKIGFQKGFHKYLEKLNVEVFLEASDIFLKGNSNDVKRSA